MLVDVAQQKLAILARAEQSVELAPVGIAGIVTDACEAYLALIADPASLAAMRSEIVELAQTGSGARRIYAAMLLRAIDPESGTAALEAMSDSNEPCDLALGGCAVLSSSVGQAAARLLGRNAPLREKES